MKLIQLNIGLPKDVLVQNKTISTGIFKEEVKECFLGEQSILGDGVYNTTFHGGADRAVCVYPFEHYSLWEETFHMELPRPAFGENFTVSGMVENDTYIGDIYRVGDAVIQVTQGRVPCKTIDVRSGCDGLMAQIVKTGYTGYFCRVLEEGAVRRTSPITLLERNTKAVTVQYANEIYFHGPKDADTIRRIVEVDGLAEAWKKQLLKRVETKQEKGE